MLPGASAGRAGAPGFLLLLLLLGSLRAGGAAADAVRKRRIEEGVRGAKRMRRDVGRRRH